ncbi:hypothetical protein XCV2042 [Xanthomonas euvesicatoria pv. vesicatoria str. 85-10]|uniref:Uncharacterized protein n=1 Tax=Xanthomonas euvesicatoria pv. vesicatoria (strain 85-10) TaxID=316273 RepID=Q3BTZ0_XANE5|nr:hypothetical protein XCV2042 [Xanthomonas euvesicatoria pv. vesicatoria str. 85-10]
MRAPHRRTDALQPVRAYAAAMPFEVLRWRVRSDRGDGRCAMCAVHRPLLFTYRPANARVRCPRRVRERWRGMEVAIELH